MKKCPFCAEDIQEAAIVCRYCSADLIAGRPAMRAASTIVVERAAQLSPGVAAVLSLIIPGAGQMYCGNVFEGLFWLVIVVIGYMAFILPGLVLHVICIGGALSSANAINKRSTSQSATSSATATATTAATIEAVSSSPRLSTQSEQAVCGLLAALANPRATFRVGRQSDRVLVAIIYVVGAFLVLRQLWIRWS